MFIICADFNLYHKSQIESHSQFFKDQILNTNSNKLGLLLQLSIGWYIEVVI